jgi:hypothetical protein
MRTTGRTVVVVFPVGLATTVIKVSQEVVGVKCIDMPCELFPVKTYALSPKNSEASPLLSNLEGCV